MSNPKPRTNVFVKLAGNYACLVLALMVLVSCTSEHQDVPTPAAHLPVISTPTAIARIPPSATSNDLHADTGEVGVEDGYIPDGEMVTPFNVRHPAIGNLEANLLDAVQKAAVDASFDGIDLFVTSGWRSERYQQRLLDEGIMTYGSEAEARRWVNTPELSTHVPGNAVDIGPVEAYGWLSQHGTDYGLCQIYANEPWHYELATIPGGTCPPQISDASAGR